MILPTETATTMEHSHMYVYNILMSPAQGIYAPGDKNTYLLKIHTCSSPLSVRASPGGLHALGCQIRVFPIALRHCCRVQSHTNPNVICKKWVSDTQLKCFNHFMLLEEWGKMRRISSSLFCVTDFCSDAVPAPQRRFAASLASSKA